MKTKLWIQSASVTESDMLIVDGLNLTPGNKRNQEFAFLLDIQNTDPLEKNKSESISNNLNVYETKDGFMMQSVLSEDHKDEQGRLRPFMFYSNDTDINSFIGSLKSELDKLGLAPYDKDIEFITNGGVCKSKFYEKRVISIAIGIIIVAIIVKCILAIKK